LRGLALLARDGRAGTVSDFFFDALEWKIRYLVIDRGSWLSRGSILMEPAMIQKVDCNNGSIRVNLDKQEVLCAPPLEFPVQKNEMGRFETGPAAGAVVSPGVPGVTFDGAGCVVIPENDPMLLSSLLRYLRRSEPDLYSSGVLTRRYRVRARDGHIGLVDDFIIDDETWQVRYFVVQKRSWPFDKKALLSPEWVEQISPDLREVVVDLPRDAMMDAPVYNSRVSMTLSERQRLKRFYRQKRNGHGTGQKHFGKH
jgi:hypothetical protein